MKPTRWERVGFPAMGRRPLRLTAAEREAWDAIVKLRTAARKRVERARLRDDPEQLARYLARNAQEAMRYRAKIKNR